MTNIAMWSGPRNISTALMYSFGNRADCIAWDEPFYGFALKQRGNDHPLRDEIIAANECDWDKLVLACTIRATKPVFYQKHMTFHMEPGFDRSFARQNVCGFFAQRPPAQSLGTPVGRVVAQRQRFQQFADQPTRRGIFHNRGDGSHQ